jgi:hypothetical protein
VVKSKIKRNLKTPTNTRTLHLSEPYDSRSTTHTARQPSKKSNYRGSVLHSSATSEMAKYAKCFVVKSMDCSKMESRG